MQLFVDEQGLRIKVYLDIENNAEARALYSAIQRGDITGMSFMFSISAEEWEELESEKPTHKIREILSVVEVSAVTFPAYEDTDIYARDKAGWRTCADRWRARGKAHGRWRTSQN